MSVIRKQPYIESLLGSMSTANLKDLRTILNSGGDNVSLSFATLTNSYKNKVTPVYFQFEDNGLKTGILIWTNSKCALICYHKYQDLLLIELNPVNHTYQKINEYCDINELRRVLDDTVESTGAIDSGNAAAGTVPIADGEGGVEWAGAANAIKGEDVEEGNAIYLLGVDSNGDVIKDELPEGIVVDESLDEASTNAVANKPVAEAISDIQDDISEINEALETKANVDGNYPTMTVGMADNLTPYDESAGDDQDDPFLFQATGTGNGSQADFATGSAALMKEKRGNSVVVNQLVKIADITPTTTVNGVTFTNNGDGTITINGTATDDVYHTITYQITAPLNHELYVGKYDNFFLYNGYSGDGIGGIFTNAHDSGSFSLYIEIANGTAINSKTIPVIAVDLTQWFNGNIPQDLLDHPENWYRYYQGSLAFNTGTIVNANSRYIKCIGRNQWDEEWEQGRLTTGGNDASGNGIRSKNYIRVISNVTYYEKVGSYSGGTSMFICYYDINKSFISYEEKSINSTFTVPSNACYVRFAIFTSSVVSSYGNDITISIYYSGESGYDQYYPYEVLTNNNDTGTEELKSAGNVADYKTPDGTITRNVGSVDLGNLTWANQSGTTDVFVAQVTGCKNVVNAKTLLAKYTQMVAPATLNDKTYVIIAGAGIPSIYIKDTTYSNTATFKSAMDGVYLYYELATPTTESGTPFSANLVIDDFGSMSYEGTSGVPQGNLIFYPVDYKAFVDTLYDYTEGTPSDIQLKSDLSTAITTFLTGLTGYDATKKQTLKNNEGTLSWEDDE